MREAHGRIMTGSRFARRQGVEASNSPFSRISRIQIVRCNSKMGTDVRDKLIIGKQT